MSRDVWLNDTIAQAASFWIICTIGEAAGHVSDDTRDAHPEIPWSSVKGTRNVLIHGYDQINVERAWAIISEFAPEMVAALEAILFGDGSRA